MKHKMKDISLPHEKLLGIYRGVVEDNNDPLLAGRCRVRVFGVHTEMKVKTAVEGIPTDELPWAQPAYGLIEGSISQYGCWAVPLQGSHVFLFFESGNILQPRFFATVPGIVSVGPDSSKGFNDPDGVYPDKTGVDLHPGDGTYPHNIVLYVHGGHIIEVDSTPDATRLHVRHVSGTDFLVDHDGNIIIEGVADRDEHIVGNETINIDGNRTETVKGDETITIEQKQAITVEGTRTETVKGNESLTLEANKVETVEGNKTLTVRGNYIITVEGQATVTVTGNCTITSPMIMLN